MIRFSTLMARTAAAVMLGSLLLLSGCHREGVKQQQQQAAALKGQFDLTVKAYKDGQFLLDGAVLSSIDLGSHFAYLKDQGQLPKRVLLIASDDAKVGKKQLQYMARMVINYGFQAYFFDGKGQLTKISPVNTKARKLEDYKKSSPTEAPRERDHMGGGYSPEGH